MASAARNPMAGPQLSGQTNGSHKAHDPPPSTLAANLVSNLTNARRPAKNDEQEDFQRMLLALSENPDGENSIDGRQEKIEHHHKLIYVVVKAVLGPLSRDNPFANTEQQLQQASEALDISIATIRETPEVLIHVAGPQAQLQSGAHVPLWLWLFPQCLPLLGVQRCQSIVEKIDKLIGTCFEVAFRSLNLWGLAPSMFAYLKNCVQGALDHLQNTTVISKGGSSSISLVLPPVGLEHEISLLGNVDLHHEGCTYTLFGAYGALQHSANILQILVEATSHSSFTYKPTTAFRDYLNWIVDSIYTSAEIRRNWALDTAVNGAKYSVLYWNIGSMYRLLSDNELCLSSGLLWKCTRFLIGFTAESFRCALSGHSQTADIVYGDVLHAIHKIRSKDNSVHSLVNSELAPPMLLWKETVHDDPNTAIHIDTFLDNYLQSTGTLPSPPIGLQEDAIIGGDDARPAKRRRTTASTGLVDNPFGGIRESLYIETASSPDDIIAIAGSHFAELGDEARCSALECLQNLACASIKTTTNDSQISLENTNSDACVICAQSLGNSLGDLVCDQSTAGDSIKVFEAIIQHPSFEQCRRPRVQAMITLRSFARHFKLSTFLDLETSSLGQWCLRSLRSSIRELRIAAGRTLPLFLLKTVGNVVCANNRKNVLEILRELSDNCSDHLTETCILAWGQIGRIADEQELNLILLRLVDYLGSSNQMVSGVAFNEILLLAEALEMTASQLFGPFWRSVAPVIVKDLQVRPQTAQLMADALSISVSELLVLTQSFTLPWLILGKKKDIVVRISQARGDDDAKNPWKIYFENINIAPIMALLLVQSVPDPETYIMGLMRSLSSHFKEIDLADLLRMEPIGIALELLKNAGEEDESKKSRVRYALQTLAIMISVTGAEGQAGKRSNVVGPFLEQYVLGIMAHFSDLLNDARGLQSSAEKRRSLKGLEELLRVGKSYIRSALPQICACLQSAFHHEDLRTSSFSAWATMCKSLDDEDVGPLLENTFSTIMLQWKDFDETSRMNAHNLFTYLYSKRRGLLQQYIEILPLLNQIPELNVHEQKLSALRTDFDTRQQYEVFAKRIGHEHSSVVVQALEELSKYLHKHQAFLQTSAISEQPDPVISKVLRAVLDACVKFNGSHADIARLSAECMGIIGCVDPNRVETIRERREYIAISNFDEAGDTTDFVLFLLEEVLVKAFSSATNPKAQGFLSYAMQELLEKCDFRAVCSIHRKPGDHSQTVELYNKWLALPDSARATLTPFLKSRYVLTEMHKTKVEYPIYQPEKKYNIWLRSFVLDLLEQPHNSNAMLIFSPLCRVIRIQDTAVASFLLPYAVLHAIILGSEEQRKNIEQEMITVLSRQVPAESHHESMNVRLCSEAIFRVLDYMSRWSQDKQAQISHQKGHDRWAPTDDDQTPPEAGVEKVNLLLAKIPPEIISSRAVECKSYARALFHWEQHIRQTRELAKKSTTKKDVAVTKSNDIAMLERLQDIYAEIDEPDGIEGISAHLNLDIDQQILSHRKNGRWAAAQSWYEIKLAEEPESIETQVNLLHCLKESGQHDVLLNYIDGMHKSSASISKLLPFAAEASWTTGRWDVLRKFLKLAPDDIGGDFNVNLGRALASLHDSDRAQFRDTVVALRNQLASSLSVTTTSSLGSCHESMVKFHVLTELEMIAGTRDEIVGRQSVLETLDRRLEVVGSYLADKQYILGIRRAAMHLSPTNFRKADIASAWLTSAKLARKGDSIPQSFNAVLHASQLGDASATIEHARLLWKDGNSRQAIQSLESAITNNAFIAHNQSSTDPISFTAESAVEQQNLLTARAHLLLAKWLDSAGQTHAAALRGQYQLAARSHQTWEKGHYYLGRHYNKLLEAEKALSPEQQTASYLTGETARLVIENFLRSLNYGTKYIFQTLPRVLTLWLDLGMQVNVPFDSKAGGKSWADQMSDKRKDQLKQLHGKLQKYVQKTPAYIFYTALPQIVARIAHPNAEVYKYIQQIIMKVVSMHPQQALWTLFAVSISTQQDRRTRGATILASLRNTSRKSDISGYDIKSIIAKGEKLASELLMVCNAGEFQGNRTVTASISRDLGFNHKICTPSPLVVPVEATLTATLPTLTDNVRTHKAFSRDIITVSSFEEKVLVLSSLQKPRKLTARGSDGQLYGLMCKPKDDLRKDQRLMEFNSMINRSLKRDAESSKRQLYIRTYAVTPLNEECGIIEWVEGLKTLRDILLQLYKARGISPNYGEIKLQLDEACKGEDKLPWFTTKVLDKFPPVFHSWFVQQFPDPSTWFVARLKYTRSCAVMSMVGTILGLGDRHGENILFEEGNGGTFHVDFNCLFDKGLSFAQPERVPFRLTHNMVDAMGVYGYEGPFRKSCELTLALLRQHEDTLMTILEAFVYDPTLDLIAKKNKARKNNGGERGEHPPDTAQGVLVSIRRKVRGLLAGESVPLGVEGQVDELIKQAVSPKNLASMYIGWCAFF